MNPKKVLFTASIPVHFKAFHLPYLKWFQDNGYETHTISNGTLDLPYIDKQWSVDIDRSPLSFKNYRAYKEIKNIIEKENFQLINCHTPVASILTRLAASSAREKGTKVLYTAHGFHFYKGAPKLYWALFYPLEIYFSKFADAIITLNTEDFKIIKEKGHREIDYYKIPGIGVNAELFFPVELNIKKYLRVKNNFSNEKFILVYSAEFIARKNHLFIIEAIKAHRDSFDNIHVIFAGRGVLEQKLKAKVQAYDLGKVVEFIGFRTDIDQIYKLADVGISSSKQEGLAINLIEEMMCGLPLIASNVRGQAELIEHHINGYLYEQGDMKSFVKYIKNLADNPQLCTTLAKNSLKHSKNFELKKSMREMTKIYENYL